MIRRLITRLTAAEVRQLRDQLATAHAERDQARRVAVRWYLIANHGDTR